MLANFPVKTIRQEQNKQMPYALDRLKISKTISKITERKSTGPDEMSIRILKEGGDCIVEAFYHLFARSLETGIVPQDWKLANKLLDIVNKIKSPATESQNLFFL